MNPFHPTIRRALGALVTLVVLTSTTQALATENTPTQAEYPLIEWTDLMPADDLEALLNPPDYLNDIVDGSSEDKIGAAVEQAITSASDARYQQALSSTRIRPEFNQKKVKIPGFIVPLEFDEQLVVTEFFLVPFFGACLHVPPPPPNQMIHVKYSEGLALANLYDPFFLEGTVETKTFATNEMGTSAYSMQITNIYPYTE